MFFFFDFQFRGILELLIQLYEFKVIMQLFLGGWFHLIRKKPSYFSSYDFYLWEEYKLFRKPLWKNIFM